MTQPDGSISALAAFIDANVFFYRKDLFAAKGLLKPVQVDPDRGLFDSNTASHDHFYVEGTGELIDVPPGAVQFAKLPALPPGTEQVAVEVVFRVRRKV